jgi:hypothetical protein
MATTWDPANADTSFAFGRGNTITGKTSANGSWKSVKGTSSQSSGLLYLEYYVNQNNTPADWIGGFGNASAALTTYLGSDTHSFGIQISGGTNSIIIYNNGIGANFWTISNGSGYVLALAIDFTHSKFWIRTDRNLTWNDDILANQNPATNTGGYTFSVTGALFPMFSALDGSALNLCTINAGAYPFSLAMPSGFSAWDTGTPSPNGQTGTTPTTWNPSDKDSHVALSNGNLEATQSTDVGNYDGVRSTTSWGSTQRYFEVTLTLLGSGNSHRGWIVGLADSSAAISTTGYPGSDAHGVGAQMGDLNDVLYNGGQIFTFNGSVTQGDVYGIAVDVNKGLWWIKNITASSNWNNNAGADPVAGVLGYGLADLNDVFVQWAGAYASSTADAATLNVGAASFTGSLPSGYAPWDTQVTPAVFLPRRRGMPPGMLIR